MENLLFLGVPILKHIRDVFFNSSFRLGEDDERLCIMEACRLLKSFPPPARIGRGIDRSEDQRFNHRATGASLIEKVL